MHFFKYPCSLISVVGIVHLELLAWKAILFHYSWCGTPRVQRITVAFFYFLLAPVVLVGLMKARKKCTTLDRIVRISGYSFLVALAIYWFFEYQFRGSWLTY